MNTVIILRGLPGSGKSTFAQTLVAMSTPGFVRVVSADTFMTDDFGNYCFDATKLAACHTQAQADFICALHEMKHMKHTDGIIIVDNTNTTTEEMWPYVDFTNRVNEELLPDQQFRIHTIIMENRHDGISVHDVPSSTIDKMHDRFCLSLDRQGNVTPFYEDTTLSVAEALEEDRLLNEAMMEHRLDNAVEAERDEALNRQLQAELDKEDSHRQDTDHVSDSDEYPTLSTD